MENIKLAIFDIDGTLRRVSSPWRHLHKVLNLSEQAKEYFPMYSRGEISYTQWVDMDAALWRGYKKSQILAALNDNPVRDGALNLIRWFKKQDIPCIGLSTGLSVFADVTKSELGLDDIICNELLFDDKDYCLGRVIINVSEINKEVIAKQILEKYNVKEENVIGFGDGSADIGIFNNAKIKVAILPTSEDLKNLADIIVKAEPIDSCIVDILSL